MIFVTGGCFQGKQQWVLQNCQVQPFRVADGAVCSMEAIKSAGVLDHFHLLVRRWMQAGKIPADETEKILSDNPDIVIITDEIGSGIVPLDVKEREAGSTRQNLLSAGRKGRCCFSRHRRHRAKNKVRQQG